MSSAIDVKRCKCALVIERKVLATEQGRREHPKVTPQLAGRSRSDAITLELRVYRRIHGYRVRPDEIVLSLWRYDKRFDAFN